MRICLLGSYAGRLDEGMANVSYYLYEHLKSLYGEDVTLLNVKDSYGPGFWKKILKIKPDIIHYFPGPTAKGMLLFKIIQIITRSKSVLSATKPLLPRYFGVFSWWLKPDITIVHSKRAESLFNGFKYSTIFIPNGVDTEKFKPVTAQQKNMLRSKYGLDVNDFIVLHVGPVRSGRNQRVLLNLTTSIKVLLVVSISNPSENEVYDELLRSKAIVWKRYFPNIEEIYSIADVYIFPLFEEQNSIEIPLSVLEAMSCNLPVITTRYGGLERLFKAGEGLFYVNTIEEIVNVLEEISRAKICVNTRSKVKSLSWNKVSREISTLYSGIMNNRKS